jgi:glycosyltransferase involved in cell wall biosynthesis
MGTHRSPTTTSVWVAQPPEKHVDVVILTGNRWFPLAREAVAPLRTDVSVAEVPPVPHPLLLEQLGAAKIFVHPARIEGRSRLSEEARSMGTVPIMLTSNRFGEGLAEDSGCVAVDDLRAIAPAVHALLDDPDRLARLAGAGYRNAREISEWRPFVTRVADALARADQEVARFTASRAVLGERLIERENELERDAEQHAQRLARDLAQLEQRYSETAEREQQLSHHVTTAEARYQALRSRKAVRAALRVARMMEAPRLRRGQGR